MKNKGIIAINKPNGWTSFDVVNKIKYQVRPLKVGHLGTLDPMATGVLLVTIGKATKLFDLMQEKTKTYIATFEFGYETNTLDSTGEVTSKCDNIPSLEEINSMLQEFIGEISQVPPKFSAKSINGKRAYNLARNNVDFEIEPKKVNIYSLKILSFYGLTLKLEICCGSGTYIRAIGRDLAYRLNSLATMTALVRTKIDQFELNDCFDIQVIDKNNIDEFIQPINKVLTYSEIKVSDEERNKLLNGLIIDMNIADGLYKLNYQADTCALIKVCDFKAKMSIFLG